MKTRTVVIIVTVVILISFGVSTFSSIISISELFEKNNSKEAQLFIEELESDITDSFADSVSISKTINNSFIRDFINDRDDYTEEEASAYVGRYLEELKRQFGYDTAFLVIDCTHEYFTEYGRMKVLDLKGEDDIWYSNFELSGKEMELNVDNDQANENRITVYNNIRMLDTNGRFIGVCGVGHTLKALEGDISILEEKYDLTVVLTDKNGVIQVSGDNTRLGTDIDSLFKPYIDNYDYSQRYEYELFGSGAYLVVKYIPEYDWYLCVESPEKIDEMQTLIMKNLCATLIALIIMVIFVSVAMKYQETETMIFKADSETDAMTGIYNKRAFSEMIEEIKSHGTVADISIVVIDVNGLKQVNDEKGHAAGDELIIKTAKTIHNLYGNHGRAFRIGGDEFAIIITEPLDDVQECIKQIRSKTGECELKYSDKLSVAIGVARGEDYLDVSVEELLELADKAMYSDKEEYYKDKRHERRAR
ncbi:MAG: GGDEF domain-containing protein [Lachnospiraceae bacterium]|nr:GGDEF domain-containing protein [Candidatus Colinaster equi]